MYFNNIPVSSISVYKQLDDKLSYELHLKFALNKVKKTIGLLRKFQQILSRQSLIRQSLIEPPSDYSDIVYDRCSMNHFTKISNLFNKTQPQQ